MYDTQVASLMQRTVVSASPETTVIEAARQMAQSSVGAVLVCDADRLVGIFTERDVLYRVVARGLDPARTKLAQVMTRDPYVIEPRTPLGYALILMQEKGFRHLPVLEHGKPVGVVSARTAMDPDLEEFRSEQRRREYWKNAAKTAQRASASAKTPA